MIELFSILTVFHIQVHKHVLSIRIDNLTIAYILILLRGTLHLIVRSYMPRVLHNIRESRVQLHERVLRYYVTMLVKSQFCYSVLGLSRFPWLVPPSLFPFIPALRLRFVQAEV